MQTRIVLAVPYKRVSPWLQAGFSYAHRRCGNPLQDYQYRTPASRIGYTTKAIT
jgi:hypothetical protein